MTQIYELLVHAYQKWVTNTIHQKKEEKKTKTELIAYKLVNTIVCIDIANKKSK
jgi:hypothetical protein